jgi:hypothetical protein
MNFIWMAILNSEPDPDTFGLGRMSPQIRERFFILAAIAVVALSAMGWAAFIRRRPRHKRRHIKPDHFSFLRRVLKSWTDFVSAMVRRPERRRTRHRPRNPTRAEVGGLPPVRTETDPRDHSSGAGPYY